MTVPDPLTNIAISIARIAAALERIADALDKNPPIVDDKQIGNKQISASDAGLDKNAPIVDVISSSAKVEDTQFLLSGLSYYNPIETTPQSLISFLLAHGIRPRDDPPRMITSDDNSIADLDALASLIGNRWDNTHMLIDAVKSRLNSGGGISLALRGHSSSLISDVCGVATRAYALGLLEYYQYHRSPTCRLDARPSRAALSQRFWTGGWLERWACLEAMRVASQIRPNAPRSWIANLPIILPNGTDFEIDLLIGIGQQQVWIETKSGDYQEHLDKYAHFRRTLGLPVERAIVLLLDRHAPYRALSALYGLSVCGIHEFSEYLAVALGKQGDSSNGEMNSSPESIA